jgi:hypothetical protein
VGNITKMTKASIALKSHTKKKKKKKKNLFNHYSWFIHYFFPIIAMRFP